MMTSTNAIQFSVQVSGGRIFVVGGSTPTEFEDNFRRLLGAETLDVLINDLIKALSPAPEAPPQDGPPDFVPHRYHDQMQPPRQEQWQQQATAQHMPPGPPPRCRCDSEMKWVPGGYSQAKQKSYAGFWACPRPRGQQCPTPKQF
jgi:hypothetical protein